MPCPCVRGARGRFEGLGPVPGVVSLPFPPSCPACPALRVAGPPVRVSLTLARWYAIPRGLCVPRARSGCPSGIPRMPFACVCARAPAASASPPQGGVACAPRAVPALDAGRAVPRVLPRSLAPSGLLGGGRSGPGSPLPCCGCGGVRASPTPQRALLRSGFARCGGGTRVPGGGASCLGVGRPGSGALPPKTARPLGGLPGPTTHWLWVRGGAGVRTRHQPHSARSCALRGRHEGARGGRLLPRCGASGVGRSPSPDCPPSGRATGAHYPLAVGVGGCRRGDPSSTP